MTANAATVKDVFSPDIEPPCSLVNPGLVLRQLPDTADQARPDRGGVQRPRPGVRYRTGIIGVPGLPGGRVHRQCVGGRPSEPGSQAKIVQRSGKRRSRPEHSPWVTGDHMSVPGKPGVPPPPAPLHFHITPRSSTALVD